MLPERVPPRVRDGRTVTFAGVQIGSACRTQALAIRPAKRVAGDLEQPVLAHRWPKIELPRVRVDRIHVGVVRIAVLGKDEVDFLAYLGRRLRQAAPAIERRLAVHSSVPVKQARAGG